MKTKFSKKALLSTSLAACAYLSLTSCVVPMGGTPYGTTVVQESGGGYDDGDVGYEDGEMVESYPAGATYIVEEGEPYWVYGGVYYGRSHHGHGYVRYHGHPHHHSSGHHDTHHDTHHDVHHDHTTIHNTNITKNTTIHKDIHNDIHKDIHKDSGNGGLISKNGHLYKKTAHGLVLVK